MDDDRFWCGCPITKWEEGGYLPTGEEILDRYIKDKGERIHILECSMCSATWLANQGQ